MGAKDSKRACLSYEDAVKRMSDIEYKRVCEAFKRLTGGGQFLSRQCFTQNVLGDGVPLTIAEWLYAACGGTQRGIALRDLICGLVLLTKGTQDEKIKFLWTLYCNESNSYITRVEFQTALQSEGTLPAPPPPPSPAANNKPSATRWDRALASLFPSGQDRVGFDEFKAWIQYNKEATVLSKWLLSASCITLSSEVETPTFYQTLAGVTHLEERDICELEKCFWSLQSTSSSGHLDLNCVTSLISPPVPASACRGLFTALDVNGDGHVDFKELCCGVSAACRGPLAERTKFCFKIFDVDRDNLLDRNELQHMIEVLLFVAKENHNSNNNNNNHASDRVDHDSGYGARKSEDYHLHGTVSDYCGSDRNYGESLTALMKRLNANDAITQEEFLVWSVDDDDVLLAPFLELLFQVCHVSLGLKPHCRHHEYEIVTGWLEREERRGYKVGQFWYLISSEWWQAWSNYATAIKSNADHCSCKLENNCKVPVEEGIVCDESFTSYGTEYASNEFNSNSTESMGDLLSRGDSCSIASSSGVSSSSGTGSKRANNHQGVPGPIDNTNLVADSPYKVGTLTGEGGRLKRDTPLVQRRDFELIPDSLWKALALWYGGPLPLPRQVIRPPGSDLVELELYPLNLRVLRHQGQQQQQIGSAATWSSVVGGYGAAALSTAGLTSTPVTSPRRYLAHTAAFSRLANVRQVIEFLCNRLGLKLEDTRLWHVKESSTALLLEDEIAILYDLGIVDGDQILLEVRNKDLTWPEELGALASGNAIAANAINERRPTIMLPPGATGLHNLGNTCFMNAALQAVSNTRPLTQYFQRDGQLRELNSSNPLGTKGQVARRYAELCRELWAGSTRSVAPLKLRYCVTKHAPHLGGGGQHDSQELLAWLLDALHEDLNRVTKKLYSELRDSDGRPDAVVAEEAWLQHLARDHSIITDLFYGQLKSKVTCQTCGHESVRFDAFNLLSLPLPMESFVLCEVLVIRLNGNVPIKYGLRLNSEAKYVDLKANLEKLSRIPASRLLLAEVASSQIRQILSDDVKINGSSATELYAYELPVAGVVQQQQQQHQNHVDEDLSENESAVSQSPLARSPENTKLENNCSSPRMSNGMHFAAKNSVSPAVIYTDVPTRTPTYLVAVHRKCVRQETYFLSQHKSKPSLFGVPLLLGCDVTSTCQGLYESVWNQVTRLLSPLPQSDQTNHATDCDDSLGYEFPFTLKAVLQGGQICAFCHWTRFCRGCPIPCDDQLSLYDHCVVGLSAHMCVAIDWDPTALHLRYQSGREKLSIEHESVENCKRLHTEPIDLDHCLRAFTSEEKLETKYHCSNCKDKQPATKKLQIWRLPPILIIHLKRFDYVNGKWVKTQKVVDFPYKDFDPTAYLASVPQETILRHRQLKEAVGRTARDPSTTMDVVSESDSKWSSHHHPHQHQQHHHQQHHPKLVDIDESTDGGENSFNRETHDEKRDDESTSIARTPTLARRRQRLESTSLIRTPIIDGDLRDFHEHKLLQGQDPFDLKYQLYAVVSHSGLLNGGHYISYACNPNGNWYCYNDSSCREVPSDEPTVPATPSLSNRRKFNSRRTVRRCDIDEDDDADEIGSNNNKKYVSNKSYLHDTSCNANSKKRSLPTLSQPQNSPLLRRRSSTTSSSSNKDVQEDDVEVMVEQEDEDKAGDQCESVISRFRCSYSNVRMPKMDNSSAYILFYERSGLDYTPYMPEITADDGDRAATSSSTQPNDVELDENESELRKQCTLQ